ncbi:MAG: DNA starvation/stationary phase protection protein [Ponticaulis sp.]|nr:DNA starvation/stationary phase protection protein [Ponticaulis sp.]|tara:strand:+ start:24960 stop:25466 length:507 start_codon:yes stop_codon:yes gene_type:complete
MSVEALNVSHPEFGRKTGIKPEDRTELAKALGVVLADTYMLFIKTQGVHWNVTGPAFVSIHELTEKHYTNMYEAIDEIAERIRALGEKAPASYTKYGELSEIEDKDEPQTAHDMLTMLIADHETAIAHMRSAVEWCEGKNDYVTADMLIARMAWHEEAVWMLKALTTD